MSAAPAEPATKERFRIQRSVWAAIICAAITVLVHAAIVARLHVTRGRLESRRQQCAELNRYFKMVPQAMTSPAVDRSLKDLAKTRPLAQIAYANLESRRMSLELTEQVNAAVRGVSAFDFLESYDDAGVLGTLDEGITRVRRVAEAYQKSAEEISRLEDSMRRAEIENKIVPGALEYWMTWSNGGNEFAQSRRGCEMYAVLFEDLADALLVSREAKLKLEVIDERSPDAIRISTMSSQAWAAYVEKRTAQLDAISALHSQMEAERRKFLARPAPLQ